MKRDRHAEIVERKMRRSPQYRRAFLRTLHQIDLALLVREMRDSAKMTQQELAERAGTTQSVIARLEDAEYQNARTDRRRLWRHPYPARRKKARPGSRACSSLNTLDLWNILGRCALPRQFTCLVIQFVNEIQQILDNINCD